LTFTVVGVAPSPRGDVAIVLILALFFARIDRVIRNEMACSDIEKPADLQGAAQSRPEGDGNAKGMARMGLVKMNSIRMLTAKAQGVMDGPDPTSKYSFAEVMRREKAEEGLWKEYCSYGHGEALTPAMLEKLLVRRAYDQRKANFHQNSLLNHPAGEMAKPVFDNSTKHNGQDREFARRMVKIGEREIPNPHQCDQTGGQTIVARD
jgi:hypothetical protein